MSNETENAVYNLITNFDSLEKARQLFSELNYDPAHGVRCNFSQPVDFLT